MNICFYDNNYTAPNGELTNILFEWVDKHDCFMIIKSKEMWYSRWDFLKRLGLKCPLAILLGRFKRTKGVWKDYPKHTKDLLVKLAKDGKVRFKFKRQEYDWALRSDVVVGVPEEACFEVSRYRDGIYLYWPKEQRHELKKYMWRKKNVTIFDRPEVINEFLDKEYRFAHTCS